jgi:thiol-disulfide isomerase/thioredoxin
MKPSCQAGLLASVPFHLVDRMNHQRFTRAVVAILLGGLVIVPSSAVEDDGWLHEFDEAVASAKQHGLDILIDFSGTDGCGPCERLWKQTLSQPDFIKLAGRHFVLLDIDNLAREAMPEGRKERYDALQERYGIHAWPTVVMATAELSFGSQPALKHLASPRRWLVERRAYRGQASSWCPAR